jgi:acyl-CoA thioesterase I
MRHAAALGSSARACGFWTAVLALWAVCSPAQIIVSNGQRIAFLGDAITQFGWQNPRGFVRLVAAGLETNGVKVTVVPAGVIGDNTERMLARLKPDVLDKKPDWVVLSCGLTDIQPGTNGVPLARFKANVAAIVDQCRAAGSKVLLLTTTVAGENLGNAANQKLAGYNEALRALASEKKCPMADLNAMFQQAISDSEHPGAVFTVGGLFMNPQGDQLMAKGILQAFGLDDAQEEKAEEVWFKMFIESHPPVPPNRDRVK